MKKSKLKIDFQSIQRISLACPSQWQGKTVDGRLFYARYRWGRLVIECSNKPVSSVEELFEDCNIVLDQIVGKSLDGFMTNWFFYSLLENENLLECDKITRFYIRYLSKFLSFLESKEFTRICRNRIKALIRK